MEAAIALARRATGTLSTISVLIGPVGRKSSNIAVPRHAMEVVVLTCRNATVANGTVATTDHVSSHA